MLSTIVAVVIACPFVLLGLCSVAAAVGAGRGNEIMHKPTCPR